MGMIWSGNFSAYVPTGEGFWEGLLMNLITITYYPYSLNQTF